ncbi:MAG TPA: ribosome-associated translation inhibitor RaiA, partial [Ktedonobacteraceae bacterium]|nr:ribosome-associated translation inhibitor RaiA [Ktedonobacteraceae bacterium]
MQIIIKGKQMDVSPRLRQYIERKVQRLSRLVNEDARIEVTVAEEQTRSARDRYSVQLSLSNNTHPIRSEVSAVNANMALDIVLNKVTAQLGRQKDRQSSRRHQPSSLKVLSLSRSGDLTALEDETAHQEALAADSIDEERNEQIWSRVMEIRRIATRPMNDQQAIA